MAGWSDKYKNLLEFLTGTGINGETTGVTSANAVMSGFISAISLIIINFPEYIESLQNLIDSINNNIDALSIKHQNDYESFAKQLVALNTALEINEKNDASLREVVIKSAAAYVKTNLTSINLEVSDKVYYTKQIGVFSQSIDPSAKITVTASKTMPGLTINSTAVSPNMNLSFNPTDNGNYLLISSNKTKTTGSVDITLNYYKGDNTNLSNPDASTKFTITMSAGKTVITKPYVPSTYSQSIGTFAKAISTIEAPVVVSTAASYNKSIGTFATQTSSLLNKTISVAQPAYSALTTMNAISFVK